MRLQMSESWMLQSVKGGPIKVLLEGEKKKRDGFQNFGFLVQGTGREFKSPQLPAVDSYFL